MTGTEQHNDFVIQEGTLDAGNGQTLRLELPAWQWRMLAWIQEHAKVNIAHGLLECMEASPGASPSQVASWYVQCWYKSLGKWPKDYKSDIG